MAFGSMSARLGSNVVRNDSTWLYPNAQKNFVAVERHADLSGDPLTEDRSSFNDQLVMSNEKRNAFIDATDDEKKDLMKKFGLTPHQYDAVVSGDLAKILTVLSEEYGPKPGDFLLP